jgi:hypothetical protein
MGPGLRRDDEDDFPSIQISKGAFTYDFAFSRRIAPEACWKLPALEFRGRRECRMRAAPAVSRAVCTKQSAHEHTGSAENIRHSLRNGFTAYNVISPADRACCHRRPSEALASSELDASIRGVRTTRLHRTHQSRSSVATSASTATRPSFVTMANAPLSGTGWLLM